LTRFQGKFSFDKGGRWRGDDVMYSGRWALWKAYNRALDKRKKKCAGDRGTSAGEFLADLRIVRGGRRVRNGRDRGKRGRPMGPFSLREA